MSSKQLNKYTETICHHTINHKVNCMLGCVMVRVIKLVNLQFARYHMINVNRARNELMEAPNWADTIWLAELNTERLFGLFDL